MADLGELEELKNLLAESPNLINSRDPDVSHVPLDLLLPIPTFPFHVIWISQTGNAPLHIAAILDRVEVLRFLLEHKATVDISDADGKSPLTAGALAGNMKVVDLLLAHGAQVSHAANNGLTPFIAACWRGRLKVAQALLHAGADIHQLNNDGNSALTMAQRWSHDNVVEWLVAMGVSP